MHNYVKSVIFALILALTVWDIITCSGIGSQSFIQQESNQQQLHNTGVVTVNTATSTQKSVNPHSLQHSINREGFVPSNKRDYVNPNFPITQIDFPAQSPKQQPSSPSRDYVNPNIRSSNTPNSPSRDYVNPNHPPNQNALNSRDYVNPNHPPNQNAPNNRDYVNPNHPSNQNAPNSRDYVNPNHPPNQNAPNSRDVISHGGVPPSPPPSSKTRDYVAPGYHPALPNTGLTTSTQPPISSWAQKVSGGKTTKSPSVVTSKPSSGTPITEKSLSPTTKRPDDGPSDVQLREFSEALLRRDVNNAAKYITANVQGKTTSQSQNDQAPQKLLQIQSEAYAIPTIAKIKLLHNNYLLDTNENEYVTAQEKNEENELLDAMLTTPIMQYTRNFLVDNGKLAKDPKEFKNLLKVLWFNMYSRGGGRIGSSGFEHIFLAELKKNEVSGLHNWIYFDQAEIGNAVDYLGYMKMIDLGEKGSILKFHFKLKGVDKPVGSMFIGTSPELEMALYTTCYLFRADRVCPLKLNGKHFIIRTYNFRYRGKNMIGSAFPEI